MIGVSVSHRACSYRYNRGEQVAAEHRLDWQSGMALKIGSGRDVGVELGAGPVLPRINIADGRYIL